MEKKDCSIFRTEAAGTDETGANPRRLYLLGDSVMKGVVYNGLPDGKWKYTVFRDDGFEPLRKNGVEIINRSRMGATVKYASENLQRLLPGGAAEGASVVLEFGGNDSDFNWKSVSDSPEAEHSPNTLPDEFVESYKACVSSLRGMGADVAIATLPPIDADRYFGHISRGLSEENILRWLGDRSMLYRWHEFYNSLVLRIAGECRCGVIDLRSRFLLSHEYRELISGDGIHPTEAGHLLARRAVCEYVNA